MIRILTEVMRGTALTRPADQAIDDEFHAARAERERTAPGSGVAALFTRLPEARANELRMRREAMERGE